MTEASWLISHGRFVLPERSGILAAYALLLNREWSALVDYLTVHTIMDVLQFPGGKKGRFVTGADGPDSPWPTGCHIPLTDALKELDERGFEPMSATPDEDGSLLFRREPPVPESGPEQEPHRAIGFRLPKS